MSSSKNRGLWLYAKATRLSSTGMSEAMLQRHQKTIKKLLTRWLLPCVLPELLLSPLHDHLQIQTGQTVGLFLKRDIKNLLSVSMKEAAEFIYESAVGLPVVVGLPLTQDDVGGPCSRHGLSYWRRKNGRSKLGRQTPSSAAV